jgi:hypothetical protein
LWFAVQLFLEGNRADLAALDAAEFEAGVCFHKVQKTPPYFCTAIDMALRIHIAGATGSAELGGQLLSRAVA